MKRSVAREALFAALLAFLPGPPAGAQQPVRGGVMTVVQSTEPPNMMAPTGAAATLIVPAGKVFDTLVMLRNEQVYEPRLATAWSGSGDGKTYTFKIRKGVKFHDGVPLTSADVAFSAMGLWMKENAFIRSALSTLEGVDMPDAETAVFRFKTPIPEQPLLGVLAGFAFVAPKHIYDARELRQNPAVNAPVGSGPFRYKEWSRGNYYIVERNPDYWDPGKPYLDRVVFRFVSDPGARAALIESQEADAALYGALAPAEVVRLRKAGNLQIDRTGNFGTVGIYMAEVNLRRKELSDVRVRRAISLAIDRVFIGRTIMEGMGRAPSGPIPSTSRFFNNALKPLELNVAKSNALLDEAGYHRGANGMRFSLSLSPSPFVAAFIPMADYIKQALGDIGINVEIRRSDSVTFNRRVYADYNFDLTIQVLPHAIDPHISIYHYFATDGIKQGAVQGNVMNYSNPAMDEVIAAARTEQGGAKRAALIDRMQAIAAEDMPLIPLMEYDSVNIFQKRVQNVAISPIWPLTTWHEVWLSK